jgi:hypothetical protein
MALKSLTALAQAVADVKKEAGDSAEYKSLLESLNSLSEKLGDAEAKPGDKRDSADDDYSFEAAEKRHVARNAEIRDGGQAESAGAQGGESK